MGELRRSAWLIIAAALVPLLLFLVLQSGFSAREQRREVERRALTTSAALAATMDGEIGRHFAALDALATARSLRRHDFVEFRSRAAELIGLIDGWRGVELIDATDGHSLLTTGNVLPIFSAVADGRTSAGATFVGYARGGGCRCLVFERLASAPAGAHWRVRLFISNESFQAMLPSADSEYPVSAIVDRSGHFIARTLNSDRLFGGEASNFLRRAVASRAPSGTYSGHTLEGLPNYTAFARSPSTGWSAHVAFSSSSIDNPARWFTASLGAAALLSLLLAAGLILFALRQVAESRRIADRMQQAQKLEALGQLTGGLAHDFNNLMTPVVGTLDFLAGSPSLDPKAKRLLIAALASARRAGKLTAQLLAFSRRQRLHIEPIHLASMLDDMGDLFRQSVGDSHPLEISQCDPGLCVLADTHQLELAILNLILNARDASQSGAPIRLTITATGDEENGEVAICVADEGIGMDEETRRRAVEPFFTTKSVGRGTGLGLAQVFGLAAQAEGRLTIDSVQGAGTNITLTLRRCGCPPPRSTATRDENAHAPEPLHLLVVDDDPLVRATIVNTLDQHGHVVDAVSDGPTALAAIAQRRFDLVLIDFAMPAMDGAEVIRRAHRVRADQEFLMVTGFADSDALLAAAPDTPVLRKPFANEDLIGTVEQFARGQVTPQAV